MIQRPPGPPRTYTLFPYTTLFRAGLQSPPSAACECFQRPEAALVIHLAVALDPVAHVQVVQALVARPRDLPQDREGAQAACGFVRIVEGVHGRERAFDAVSHGHAEQAAVDAELEETPVRPRADQELPELAGAGEIGRAEEHTSELQSLMRISYAVFCLKQQNPNTLHVRI